MQAFKLLSLFLIGLLVLSSCSSDDDDNNDTSSIDSALLVGTWKPILYVQVCTSGSENISEYTECVQMTRGTFFENGTYHYSEFNLDCEEYLNYGGNWSIFEETLILTKEQQIDTITFFEITNDKLRTGHYTDDPQNTCDGENPQSHWYSELIRVED